MVRFARVSARGRVWAIGTEIECGPLRTFRDGRQKCVKAFLKVQVYPLNLRLDGKYKVVIKLRSNYTEGVR
jgi:hypothetical protein